MSARGQTYYHNVVNGAGYNIDIIANGTRYATATGGTPTYQLSTTSATYTAAEGIFDKVISGYYGLTLFDSTYLRGTTNYNTYKPLPFTNRIIQSAWNESHFYQLQNATGNNAIKMDGAESKTFTPSSSQSYSDIYILAIGGNSPSSVTATLNYSTGSSGTTTFTCQDWYGGSTTSTTSQGVLSGYSAIVNASATQSEVGTIRTSASNGNSATASNVKLYESRIITDATRTLSSITFTNTTGQVNILALTGTPTYTVSGTVFSDSTNDNIANGIGSNTGAQYVVGTLNNTVISVAAVASNGAYSFTGAPALAGSTTAYTLYLSTTSPTVGSTVSQSTLTSGWYDSTYVGSTGVGTTTNAKRYANVNASNLSSNTNLNFSIHKAPTSDTKTYTIASPTYTGTVKTMSSDVASASTTNDLGQLTGVSLYPTSGTVLNGNSSNRTVVITSLPANGQLVYNGTAITASNYSIANYDKTKFNFSFTGSGYTTTSFAYNLRDAIGFASTSNATYTINLPYPLPVAYTQELQASILNKEINLTWATGNEINNKLFQVQRSADASTWTDIGNVNSYYSNGTGSGHSYSFTDAAPLSGVNYYRLNQVDFDGTSRYGTIIQINYVYSSNSQTAIYPNPVIDELNIINLPTGATNIVIYSMSGKAILQKEITGTAVQIGTESLPSAVYFVNILDKNGQKIKSLKFVKK